MCADPERVGENQEDDADQGDKDSVHAARRQASFGALGRKQPLR